MTPFVRQEKGRRDSSAESSRTASRASSRPSNFSHPSRAGTYFGSGSLQDSIIPSSSQPSESRHRTPSTHVLRHDSEGTTLPQPGRPNIEADEDSLDDVVMAVNLLERGTLGCAYYVASNETLYFMEDSKLAGATLVDNLKMFIEPTVVLVSTKCDDAVYSILDPEVKDSQDAVYDQTRLPYALDSRPNAEFGYDAARNKLVNLRIGQRDGPKVTFVVPGDVLSRDEGSDDSAAFAGRQGQLLKLAGWINMESVVTVGCAGAVLSYLQRRRAAAYLPGEEGAEAMLRVSTVEMFTLNDMMFVNADTLLSLQITSTESHPNAQNQGPASRGWSTGGSKEGLSVYGLFYHFAKTTQGRLLLRQYFLRPSLNVTVINDRLDTVGTLLKPENVGVLEEIVTNLSRIKNMRMTLVNLRKGSGSGKNRRVPNSIWPAINDFAFFALRTYDCVNELKGAERMNVRVKMMEGFDKRALATVGQLIGNTIDLDASREQGKTVILPNVDEELDAARSTYDGIESLLSHVTDHVVRQVPAALHAKISVIFFPQIGFLIACNIDEETGNGVYEGPDNAPWQWSFSTPASAYYKNPDMLELDQNYGDIWTCISDREIEIAQQLGENVLEYDELLNLVSDLCGEVDSMVALARGAVHHNLVRPRLTEQNIIKIKGGRHLLQELTVPAYVPNDTYIVGGLGSRSEAPPTAQFLHQEEFTTSQSQPMNPSGPSMVLMTGPNYSGKSVYLKQVAIIVYMAHVGSFVPAEAAKIGLTDKILTRISTRESVSRMQSAFMIDLQQMSIALSLATHRSLLIIDEPGKGTDTCDGAGLAAGVFEHLLQRAVDCPKVLGATHFHEIFEAGFLQPQQSLKFAHMEVRLDTNASDVDDQITYLYSYRQERSNASYGTTCAAINGIDRRVVERAEGLQLLTARGEDIVEACAEMGDAELAELEDAETIARRFLEVEVDDCQPRRVIEGLLVDERDPFTSTSQVESESIA